MHLANQAAYGSALLLIDVINDLEFPGGDRLFEQAHAMAKQVAMLKRRARRAEVPVIYVNGDDDRWQPSFSRRVDRCLRDNVRGRPVVELLRPEEKDYFVLKSQHSPCFLSNLDVLLEKLHVRTLILTGMAADLCVLFSANDIYLSSYHIVVPSDCIASKSDEGTASALRQLRHVLGAEIRRSEDLRFTPVY